MTTILAFSVACGKGFTPNDGSSASTTQSTSLASETNNSDTTVNQKAGLEIVSFQTSSASLIPGQNVTVTVKLKHSGAQLETGKNVFVHFVQANNPNWFAFSLYPLTGADSSSWNGEVTLTGQLQIPLTAQGDYSIQVGLNDPSSKATSKNVKVNGGKFKETYAAGEIGYRYVVADLNVTGTTVTLPPPAAGADPSFLSADQIRSDVAPQSVLKSDYALSAPAETYHNWYFGWRPGNGPNPPAGFSAQVGWYEFFTNRNNPPGVHNWGIAVLRLIELEERNGVWVVLRDTTDPQKLASAGASFSSYNPQTELPIEKRVKNGRFELRMPDQGGHYHGFGPSQMTINGTGASHRMVLVQTGLVVWDETKPDDRVQALNAGKATVCHTGLDYWRYAGAPFLNDFSNNSDMGISRARVIGLVETPSWHSHHTISYNDVTKLQSSLAAVKSVLKQ